MSNQTETVTDAAGKAVATRDQGGRALVAQYAPDFKQVMPSHIKPEQWIRLAQGALKKGKKVRGPDGQTMTELELAAISNPGVFCGHLLNAARLGLEPGTEQYYLTSRKVQGNPEILGIVGYQGYIELMYRAGAISSVVAEIVYQYDTFVWTPGALDIETPKRWEGPQTRPLHLVDWMATNRGDLKLVYAYAVMKDGATSKVVVLNEQAIAKIRASSTGADSQYSPWKTHTGSMWLKSAVRQLAKWVPTSAEYIREQLRAQRDVAAETGRELPANVTDLPEMPLDDYQPDGAVVDAEIVDEAEWAADAQREKK